MRAKRKGQSALLLLDVIEILRRENIDYLVIGAFALSAHGVVRASTDVDALLNVSKRRMTHLRRTFGKTELRVLLRQGDPDDPIPMMLVLSDTHGNQVDLLGGLRGLDPRTFSRGIDVAFAGETLRVVSLEDLIAMKCFAGGPVDLADAHSIYHAALVPPDLDLLRNVTRRFGRAAADSLEHVLASRDGPGVG